MPRENMFTFALAESLNTYLVAGKCEMFMHIFRKGFLKSYIQTENCRQQANVLETIFGCTLTLF